MKKPLIGILGSIQIDQGGMFPGYERAYVNNDYIVSVVKAGGIPIIIPVIEDEELIMEQIKRVDGIVISGGYDVNPLSYGDEPHEKLGFIYPKRDKFDIYAIKTAYELEKPILGICRGHQILNVAFGGNLYQDMSLIDGAYIKHTQQSQPGSVGHSVHIKKGTKLYDIFKGNIVTNSFHHQAVKDVARDFIVSAVSKDGVIEAIEKDGDAFVMGIQWHPEMMTAAEDENMVKLFKKLVEESLKEN